MKKTISLVFIVFFGLSGILAQKISPQLTEVRKIWDQAPHNAFTDLIHFNSRWFCVFREGNSHVSSDGAIRIITSGKGEKWQSAALIKSDSSDLRDAKITITPWGQLMLSGAEALHNKSSHSHQSLAWFSDDGFTWSKACKIGDPDFWLWRISWKNNCAYSFAYQCGENKSLRLYKSKNGKNFEILVSDLNIKGYPNETSLLFKNDTAYCLLRRDGEFNTAKLGKSMPPYKNWEWIDLGIQIGGPQMIMLPNGKFIAGVRLQKTDSKPKRTALCRIDPVKGTLSELLMLPSGGDSSYPGMVYKDGILWVSYYSSHEGKTSVYLAKLNLP